MQKRRSLPCIREGSNLIQVESTAYADSITVRAELPSVGTWRYSTVIAVTGALSMLCATSNRVLLDG